MVGIVTDKLECVMMDVLTMILIETGGRGQNVISEYVSVYHGTYN